MTNEPPFVCPGGAAVNVDRERWVAQCPGCAYTFSTLMDDPVVPPHYVTPDGVTFGPGVEGFRPGLAPWQQRANEPPWACDECEHSITGLDAVSTDHATWCSLHPSNVSAPHD